MHLNMLPVRYRRQQLLVRRLRQWAPVWIATLFVAAGIGWFQASECRSLSMQLRSYEGRLAQVKQSQSDLAAMRSELEGLRGREALVLELSEQRPVLTLLGLVSRAARECDGNVFVTRLAFGTDATTRNRQENPDQAGVLTLEGVGLDNLSIARFAAAIRSNDIFQDVKLRSTGEQTIEGKLARSYIIECAFN